MGGCYFVINVYFPLSRNAQTPHPHTPKTHLNQQQNLYLSFFFSHFCADQPSKEKKLEMSMDKQRALEELKTNPRIIRFNRLCKIADMFDFRYRGGKGSHVIFVHEGVEELLNFQNASGWAKPYQVRQLIKIIEKYSLTDSPEKYDEQVRH